MLLLLVFQFAKIFVPMIETLFPETVIARRPVGNFLQRRRLEPARPPLRIAAAPESDQEATTYFLTKFLDNVSRLY
jgi:hypothetical protein